MCDETTYRKGLSAAVSLANINDPVETITKIACPEGHVILHHQDTWHGSAGFWKFMQDQT